MNIDFLANVNKTSGTPFAPSNPFGTTKPGFREEINQAMRDNDRKSESAVEKKPADNKKPAAADQTRKSAKTDAPKKNDRADRADSKYADNEAAVTEAPGCTEETSEENCVQFALAGEDSGFNGELENLKNLEEAENAYIFAPEDGEASGTENAYTSNPATETPLPGDIADPSVSFSTDPLLFSSLFINEDSRFASMMNIDTDVETTGSTAAQNTDQNTAQNVNTLAEIISNTAVGRPAAAEAPVLETGDVNVQQNTSLSGSGDETANSMKELLEKMSGELEAANVKSAQPEAKANEILENGLLPKDQSAAQNTDRNSAASLRGDALRNEIQSESKNAVNAEIELSEQSSSRSSSENEAQLMDRLSAQMQITRPKENGALANASENAGKTIQFAEASVQAMSGAAKAEAAAPPRSVNVQDQEFVIELAGRIQAQIRGGREMIRIQLHPEELGRLEIRAENGRNGIIARIVAETSDVKKLLESNIQNLQQTLEARGLKIDRLHIVVEDNAYAAFADAGRYGHAGAGPRNSEISEFSKSAGAGIESLQEEDADDLSAEAEQRGVGFYTVG